MRPVCRMLALLPLALALTRPVRADDWPQFRHDANHSATSADCLSFPLKELWTWKTQARDRHTPLYHSVAWHGNVYFTASAGSVRSLICADARTGNVKWRKPLQAERLSFALSDVVGPAVSESGKVFVYDWITGPSTGSAFSHPGQGSQSSGSVEAMNTFAVRTFDAATGREGVYFPLAAMGANGILPRLSLTDTLAGQEVRPVPPTFVGCPP